MKRRLLEREVHLADPALGHYNTDEDFGWPLHNLS